tara:strand:- start:950 stop:1180 length:231 start_codon:yes stop_codon:yes gene_type:complete
MPKIDNKAKSKKWLSDRKKIYWKDLPSDFDYEITWHDAIKNIEKLVDEKRLELMKDQDFHNAHLLDKYLNVIKRGY